MNIDTILDQLMAIDPIIGTAGLKLKSTLSPIEKRHSKDYLSDLCESIVSQQLSVKAARTIWARTHEFVNDWNNPEDILDVRVEDLRTAGLSGQKSSYVKNIALAVKAGQLRIAEFDELSDEEIIRELITVKGIGKWTAEMFLIFTLAREDVFSAGDLGLRNAISRLYGIGLVTPAIAEEKSLIWKPHRSVASRILWKSLDNEPVL